eukprot:1161479-Pelagomonas_calceolata.AAC.5
MVGLVKRRGVSGQRKRALNAFSAACIRAAVGVHALRPELKYHLQLYSNSCPGPWQCGGVLHQHEPHPSLCSSGPRQIPVSSQGGSRMQSADGPGHFLAVAAEVAAKVAVESSHSKPLSVPFFGQGLQEGLAVAALYKCTS